MINNRFLFFKTQLGFEDALRNGGVSYNSIVFIKNPALIWTHGKYFMLPITILGDDPIVPTVIVPDVSGLVTEPNMVNYVLNALNDYVTNTDLQQAISNVENQIPEIPEYTFKTINGLSIEGSGDIIITQEGSVNLKTINGQSIVGDGDIEIQLVINNYYENPDSPTVLPCNCPNHVFLLQREYDALEEPDQNTIYFILEGDNIWRFGDRLPIVFNNAWEFGLAFPITFSKAWEFGQTFPITLN